MHTSATMQLQNCAEDHQRPVMATRSLPEDTLGRLKHWWPSQAYHCTFCTRVFRTAQALGGHMNIHRRERASVGSPIVGSPIVPTSRLVPHQLLPAPASSSRPGFLITNLQGAPPRPGCNGGYGKLNLVMEQPARSTTADPLTWLFSQLPPPRPPLQGMPSGATTPRMASKPFHRGLAVCKSPPGVRRHVCRIHTSPVATQTHVLYTGLMQSRTRGLADLDQYQNPERISHGTVSHHQAPADQETALDLELRL